MYEAKIVADSIGPNGVRITTLQLRYWRAIHAELMTHRVFSRNASSSRAIPVKTLLKQVREQPFGPLHWGANQPGMQAHEELKCSPRVKAERLWREAANQAADSAEAMMHIGLHKQAANRILEPFCGISVVVTSTEWDNFFELRDHPDAQPEIRHLAQLMRAAMNNSEPEVLGVGEWHLPYVLFAEKKQYALQDCLKASTARCARVSYLTHDGENPDIRKDASLHDKLIMSKPIHASPCEHQAAAMVDDGTVFYKNFRGWMQYRAIVEQYHQVQAGLQDGSLKIEEGTITNG